MREVVTKVYQFDELSDKAQERARTWYRDGMQSEDYSEHMIADAVKMGELLGITFKTRPVKLMNGSTRMDPCIYWSGFSSQGDGACFEGTYRYGAGAVACIEKEAPPDGGTANAEINRIALALREAQRRHGYGLTAAIAKSSPHYEHERTVAIDVYDNGDNDISDTADGKIIADELRAFMRWIYRGLETEYEYQTGDEQIAENIRANEYEFYENGDRARD